MSRKTQAKGRVRGVSPTGMSINDVPMMRIEVDVLHPQVAPYVARFELLSRPRWPRPSRRARSACIRSSRPWSSWRRERRGSPRATLCAVRLGAPGTAILRSDPSGVIGSYGIVPSTDDRGVEERAVRDRSAVALDA